MSQAEDIFGGDITPVPIEVTDTRSARARRWSRLDHISILNFKAIESATIPLGDLTVLVGPNGSGKSSALQAIHWAARAASYISPKNTKEVVSLDRIDYLPSSDPMTSAYKSELRSGLSSNPTKVTLTHTVLAGEETPSAASVSIYAGRNRQSLSVHLEGQAAVTPYKQRSTFLTAYIPGLAGLSERETLLAQPQLRRQAASGDAGSVLRNILLNLQSQRVTEEDQTQGAARLFRLNELVSSVHPGLQISVSFDAREDYYITALYTDFSLNGQYRPLETCATGVLQVVQIFAYIILFEPKILLIDEPDAHLHPDKQERLVEALEEAATSFDTQIVLTTHSPHIARAASAAAKLVWMQDGAVRTDDDGAIRRMLGWGGLDKQALFFVEDEEDVAIRAILRQWPDLARRIAVCRCFGIDNLPKDKLLEGLLIDGQLKVSAIVHRDRDFMTDPEVEKWLSSFKTDGVHLWPTVGCDVEAYFCQSNYLAALYGIAETEAEDWRVEAAALVTKVRETFENKRKEVTRAIWGADGGGPHGPTLFEKSGGITPENCLGKKLLRQLKVVAKAKGYDATLLDKYSIPENFELGSDLKEIIVSAIT